MKTHTTTHVQHDHEGVFVHTENRTYRPQHPTRFKKNHQVLLETTDPTHITLHSLERRPKNLKETWTHTPQGTP